jgi:hypothetical protein
VTRRNVAVLVTVLVLAAGSLVAVLRTWPLPAQAGAALGAEPGTASWALARAKATGQEVAVEAEQAERRDVRARPDGSFRMRLFTHPVRARTGHGWVPIDTTLHPLADGTVGAAATELPVVFSGGGDAPLVRLGSGAEQIALRWPAPLPEPTIAGSTATYAQVFPGVDLRLTATESGFNKILVIKDRAAAANPALRELRVGVQTTGAVLRDDGLGNVGAFDAAGGQVFGVGAPAMWDSTPTTPRQALSVLRADAQGMVLRPDRAMLEDPRTVYPVFVDPPMRAGRVGFTTVVSGNPTRGYWGGIPDNDQDTNPRAKVGYCGWNYCNGIGITRSFFVYDVRSLSGKTILSSEFNAFLNYSPSCNIRGVRASSTTRATTATTWRNQPTLIHDMSERHVAYGYSTSCPAAWIGFPAPQAVPDALIRNGGYATIMLRAINESDELAWKKFGPNPTLDIVYNTKPNAATNMSAEGKPCALEPNEPYVNPFIDGDPNKGRRGPRLAAKVVDPDGDTVKVEFAWQRRDGTAAASAFTGFKASGSIFTMDVPSAQVGDDTKLRYRARGNDGREPGPWGPWCDVTIDRLAPTQSPSVSSTTYPRCFLPGETPDDPNRPCPFGGGIGRTGTFTVRPDPADLDVTGFRYNLTATAPRYVTAAAGGVTNILITPPDDGPMDLYVRSVDRAGNLGPEFRYHFFVGVGTPPVAQWRLNGITETTAVDDSANHHDGAVPLGPTTWKVGRHGDALWFNGSASAFVNTTNGPAVHTNGSFTVSAWVKLDTADSNFRTAVSLDGSKVSAFYLQYNGSTRKWNLGMTGSDVADPVRSAAESALPAVAGRWTHLLGVFDASTKQVRLYVDGVAGTTATLPTTWDAGGTVQLGRHRASTGYVCNWLGSIDEVRLYDRTLGPAEIAALAGVPANEELFLPLEEGSGTTVVDASGNYRVGTVGSAGSWTTGLTDPDGVVGKALSFDGTNATLTVPGPVVRTDASFTATAWVNLAAADANWRTVLSQDGNRTSGFELGYRGDTQRWTFRMPTTDVDSPSVIAVDDASGVVAGLWTHLAAVYDQGAGQLRLYVNGALVGQTAMNTGWNATGALQVGRGKKAGAVFAPFAGVIDDVHVWTGVRTADQILADKDSTVTRRVSAYSGQLSRFANVGQFHIVTTGPVPPGSHFEASYGVPAPAGAPGTQIVYSCRRGATDYLLSLDCGSDTKLGVIGPFYTAPPAGVATIPVYRCAGSGEHFVSSDPGCEGKSMEVRLGYTRAYSTVIRFAATSAPNDRQSSTVRALAPYREDTGLGMVASTQIAGTTALMSCQDGADVFSSVDAACEGATVLRRIGYIWTAPPAGVADNGELFRCRTTGGERFDSRDPACEGGSRDRSLGYVATEV